MPSRKRNERKLRALCADVHPDDGLDPRDDRKRDALNSTKPDRKLRQLCKQVERTLHLALADLPQADALAGVTVREVTPAPDAGRLCAVVAVPDPDRRDPVLAVLRAQRARLRSEVATAISRRRVPDLTFVVVVEGGRDA